MTDPAHYRLKLLLRTIQGRRRDVITSLILAVWIIMMTVIAKLTDTIGLAWLTLFGMGLIGSLDLWIRKPVYTEDFCPVFSRIAAAVPAALPLFNASPEYHILSVGR